jgi:soluble lytic murein transglycosylase-like protein
MIRETADRHSVSPALVEAIARVESAFNPRAVSHKGARGLMQVMPATGRRFGVRSDKLFDPEHNLKAGVAYLAWLSKRYRGDIDLIAAAYNAGEGAVDDHGGIPPYRETRDYVKRVKAALRSIEERELAPAEKAAVPEPVEAVKQEEPAEPLRAFDSKEGA